MFLINGEILKVPKRIPSTPGTITDIMTAKEELDNIGYPIMFKLQSRLIKVDKKGNAEYPAAKRMVSRKQYKTEESNDDVIYCERFKHDENDNIDFYPRKIIFEKMLIIDKEDWEKAVFLYAIAPKSDLVLYNPGKETRELAAKRSKLAKITGCIYTPEAFGLTDSLINKIALSYGIITDDLDYAKNRLFDAVKLAEEGSNQGFDNFLEVIKLGEVVNIKANIQIGVENGKIKAFKDQSLTWAFTSEEGKIGENITSYKSESTKIDELVQFYLHNNDQYKVFLSVLGKLAVTIKEEEED